MTWRALLVGALATSLLLGEAAAQERTIPVRTGAGRLSKRDKDAPVRSRGSTGVFKRGSAKDRLDPTYDPAKVDAAIKRGGVATAAAPASGDDAGGGAADEPTKKVEDIVTIRNNFTDIKCRKLPLKARVTMDFEDAPIESITKLMSCWLERNILIKTNKRGAKVSILSPQPVSVYEAWRAYLAALHANGLTIVKKGKFYHLTEANDVPTAPVVKAAGNNDAVVTQLIRLEHIDAKEVEPLVNKFKSKTGSVFTYLPTNTLIITDAGSNIRSIGKLLEDVDQPMGREKIFVRPVQHMAAAELVERVKAVFGEAGKKAPARRTTRSPRTKRKAKAATTAGAASDPSEVKVSKIIADERTNQLILVATRSSYLKVDALIRKLDVPIPGEGQIHIHHLENADAEELSQTLSTLAGGSGGARSRGSRGKSKGKAKAGAGGSAALFEGEVKITAYKPTNSLVIESSLKDYLSLSKVIRQLDAQRKQVYVEAVIMEISSTKSRNVQIAGSAGTTFDIGGETVPMLIGLGGLGIGAFDINQLNSGGGAIGLQGPLLNVATGNTGGAGGAAVPAGVSLSIPAFGFMVQAIQENSDVNVLSTPHILTLNNEEAEIEVGRKVPYRQAQVGGGLGGLGGLAGLGGLGGAAGGLGGALGGLGGLGGFGGLGGLGNFIQFVDVNLTLKITPQINESDFVKLEIDQQLDEIEAMDPNLGPTTSKRKINNTVVVRDQQPVVIGGLVTDRESSGVAKIPVLGDLPLIGVLFRKSTSQIEKKNLLLIVVPHIIKDPSDIRRVHDEKMEQMRELADELATKQKEYAGEVDYRKKTGFLQRIHTAVAEARKERQLREKAYYDSTDVDMVGPAAQHDLEFDPLAPAEGDDADEPSAEPTPAVEVIDLPAPADDEAAPAGAEATAPPADKKASGGEGA